MNQIMPSTSSSDFLSPTSTIVRIRRKRTTDPLAGLVVSSKKLRTDNEVALTSASATTYVSTPEEKADSREMIYRLVGTSEDYKSSAAAPFLDCREHKVVEMVDYNPEQNSLGRRQLSVLDHGYLEVMNAARAISDFGLDEKEKKEFEKACTAPLAEVEMMDGAAGEELGESNKDYVYDFYWSNNYGLIAKNKQQKINSSDTLEVRLPTDEELQLFYGGENGDSDEEENDSQDSNAENDYRNDYPDEDEFEGDNNENESTSDDDYDHYGDEAVNYDNNVCCNDSDDSN